MSASSSHTKNTQRERLEAKEQSILKAATDVFTALGVDGTTMAEIARRAHIAEGTLYLYHKNKQDLLAVVVGNFWADLTKGALIAVDASLTVNEQLNQLATYHLTALIQQFDMVGLTYRARLRHGEPEYQLPKIREYVRVFDQIIERGINRNQLSEALPLWQCRDVFYGSLEYSARTLLIREIQFDPTVVEQLLVMFQPYMITEATVEKAGLTNTSDDTRLARIEAQLALLLKEKKQR